MGRSVRYLSFLLLWVAGCAAGSPSGYISRADHPYDRTIYASYEKAAGALIYVLKKGGWTVSEANPSIYERDERYENNGYQNLLIMARARKSFLNVLIHSINNTCEVQIRYESQKWLLRPFISTRNDKLVQAIWDSLEAELK